MQEAATVAGREPGNSIYRNWQTISEWRSRVATIRQGRASGTKIEHRLFSFISLTWKGQPLINYETVVNLIGATKTRSRLRVKAVLDTNEYEIGVKITKSPMEALRIRPRQTHPDWNYTLDPCT